MAGSESDSSQAAGKDEGSTGNAKDTIGSAQAPSDDSLGQDDARQAQEPSQSGDEDKPAVADSASPESNAGDSPAPTAEASRDGSCGDSMVQPHHVSRILDEVLEEPVRETPSGRRFRHPMLLDFGLGIGLLVAMAGFTIGLFKMYLIHSADQSITQHNYKAAIALLKGSPLPACFNISGPDADELLSQALYLDAMEKIDVENDTDGAMKELSQIRPGSRYFSLAQEILSDNFVPSATTLQGSAEQIETNPPPPRKKSPLDESPGND